MTVRTQVYLGLLYQQIIRENKLKRGARLPMASSHARMTVGAR
jgi:hypothetical protein